MTAENIHAARAAGHSAAAAYLHPLAKATQVRHILGSAADAARALALDSDDNRSVAAEYIEKAASLAGPVVVRVPAIAHERRCANSLSTRTCEVSADTRTAGVVTARLR
ncbi:hypothetical protein APR08_001352 [Nocardia amikacinitolerans]|nr:hypothetical protein [Nocardia amikacinitolerans]